MTAVLLDGASSPDDPAYALCTEVERQLAAQFDTVRCIHLTGYDIGHCMGEFDCFVKTPGRCRIHDEGQEIERAVHDAELVVLVTPWHHAGPCGDHPGHVVLDEPNTVTPEARSRGEVPACLVRLTGPCCFRLP